MTRIFFLATGLILVAIVINLLNSAEYVRETESRVVSSCLIALPDDGPSRKNTALAAGIINGIIVNPGEVFSFNSLVGPRTTERGFAEGLSVLRDSGGKLALARDVGGGICRASTGLHQAVVAAGLEVKERHDHLIPVDYAEKGRDAALLYGKQDYKFKNSGENPVRIVCAVEGDNLRVSLEEKIQSLVRKHNLFNPGAIHYYREKIKTARESLF